MTPVELVAIRERHAYVERERTMSSWEVAFGHEDAQLAHVDRGALLDALDRLQIVVLEQNDEIERLNRWANALGKSGLALTAANDLVRTLLLTDHLVSYEDLRVIERLIQAAIAECRKAEHGDEPTHGGG